MKKRFPNQCVGRNAWRCEQSVQHAIAYLGSNPGQATDEGPGPTFAEGYANVHFFSTRGLLCTSEDAHGVCSDRIPGTDIVAYLDHSHLRRGGSVYLAPYLCSAFERFGFYA